MLSGLDCETERSLVRYTQEWKGKGSALSVGEQGKERQLDGRSRHRLDARERNGMSGRDGVKPLGLQFHRAAGDEAAVRQVRRFAHVQIGEDGWLVSGDKLLKNIEVKVDVIQSRAARGASSPARLALGLRQVSSLLSHTASLRLLSHELWRLRNME